jgi:hypothetical protein
MATGILVALAVTSFRALITARERKARSAARARDVLATYREDLARLTGVTRVGTSADDDGILFIEVASAEAGDHVKQLLRSSIRGCPVRVEAPGSPSGDAKRATLEDVERECAEDVAKLRGVSDFGRGMKDFKHDEHGFELALIVFTQAEPSYLSDLLSPVVRGFPLQVWAMGPIVPLGK